MTGKQSPGRPFSICHKICSPGSGNPLRFHARLAASGHVCIVPNPDPRVREVAHKHQTVVTHSQDAFNSFQFALESVVTNLVKIFLPRKINQVVPKNDERDFHPLDAS